MLGAGDLGASVAITALPAGTADRRSPECDGHFPEGTIASVASAQATFTSAADGVKGREVVAQYRSGDAQRLLDGMRTSFAACGSGAALTLSDGTAVTVTYRSVELPTAGARGDVPVVAVSYDVTRSGTSTHQYGVQTYARFGEIVVLTQVEAPSTARAVAVADAALAAVVQRAG